MSRRVAYVCKSDAHRLLFEQALGPLGFSQVLHYATLEAALDALREEGQFRLVIIDGPLPGVTPGDSLVSGVRAAAKVPLLLLNYDGGWSGSAWSDVTVLPPPITAAAVVKAAAKLRRVSQGKLVSRLLRSPGFETFSEDALAFLLDQASAVQLRAGDVLFDAGTPGDTMYFVLSGCVSIHLGDREVEQVRAGGVFGEMAMLEGRARSAMALAEETSVLLEVRGSVVDESTTAFRAVLFELITRTLVRRLRRSDELIAQLDAVLPRYTG